MKHYFVITAALCGLLLSLTATPVSAQCCDAGKVPVQQFSPQHEFRLSAGWQPLTYDYWTDYDRNFNPLTRHGAVYTSGVWSLSYGYRFNKWFDLGVLFSYYGQYSAIYSNVDNRKLHPDTKHNISILPVARFTWLNRPLVRMYSSVALGALIEVEEWSHRSTEAYVGGQLVLIGVSVGKSLFGFAELGAGTQGIATIGIGYRFNDKKR